MKRGVPLALSAGAAVIVVVVVVWRLASGARDAATPIAAPSAPESGAGQPLPPVGTIDSENRLLPADTADSTAEPRAAATDVETRRGDAASLLSVLFAGRAVDDVGVPLVGHAIEVYTESASGLEFGKLEARAVTNSDGRFRIAALPPGPKRVVICGPGDGDIWDEKPDIHGYHAQREERELMLGIPDAGLDDFVFRGVDHTGILVTASVVDELGQPVLAFDFVMTDEDDRWGALMNIDGRLSGIVPVRAAGDYELHRSHPSFHLDSDPLNRTNYVPLKVHLTRTSDRLDLGTLVMTRMAGLKLTLVDAKDGMGIGDADVRLHVTGGGQPPDDIAAEVYGDGSYNLWSGRSSGDYELDVKAPGYQPLHQIGVLVAGDAPVPLELKLEPRK